MYIAVLWIQANKSLKTHNTPAKVCWVAEILGEFLIAEQHLTDLVYTEVI